VATLGARGTLPTANSGQTAGGTLTDSCRFAAIVTPLE
jgi:hypothetical protein